MTLKWIFLFLCALVGLNFAVLTILGLVVLDTRSDLRKLVLTKLKVEQPAYLCQVALGGNKDKRGNEVFFCARLAAIEGEHDAISNVYEPKKEVVYKTNH